MLTSFVCDDGKYRFIYKITISKTGEYYYGQHITSNLDDGYMGSGVILNEYYKQNGTSGIIKEILEYAKTTDELDSLEKMYISKSLGKDPKCLNKAAGGHGGFRNIGWNYMTVEEKEKLRIKLSKSSKERQNQDGWYDTPRFDGLTLRQKISIQLKKEFKEGKRRTTKGYKFTEDAKQKLRNAHLSGNYKPQKWIYDPVSGKSIMINKDSEIPNGWLAGRCKPKHTINTDHPTHQWMWIKKEDKCIYIRKSEWNSYQESGWIKGRL